MKITACTEWLFFHLWKRNPETDLSCPGIFIQDTIIYRWAKPHFWYFTNKQGDIIRKTKERILNEQVDEVFNDKEDSKHGIISKYMSSNSTSQLKFEKNQTTGQIDKITIFKEIITYEYLTTNNWNQFLYQREKEVDGILQKFIEPKDAHNSMIKVTWSPQFRLMERKTNLYNVNNNKIDTRIKLSTWEGPEQKIIYNNDQRYLLIQEQALSPIICSDIEQVCQNIHRHIVSITAANVQIQKMVLFFTLDYKNRLWLLYCTSLKLKEMDLIQSNRRIRVESPVMRQCQHITEISSKKGAVQVQLNGEVETLLNNFNNYCSNCEKLYPQLLDLKFKQIIETYENKTQKNPQTILPDELQKMKNYQDEKEKQRSETNQIKKNKIYGNKEEELQDLLQFIEDDQKNTEVDIEIVPPLISKVWGTMSKQRFFTLKKNLSWLNFQTKVCDDCYLENTAYMLEPDIYRETRHKQTEMRFLSKLDKNDIHENEGILPNPTVQLDPTQTQQTIPEIPEENTLEKQQPVKKSTTLPKMKKNSLNKVLIQEQQTIPDNTISHKQISTVQNEGNSSPKNDQYYFSRPQTRQIQTSQGSRQIIKEQTFKTQNYSKQDQVLPVQGYRFVKTQQSNRHRKNYEFTTSMSKLSQDAKSYHNNFSNQIQILPQTTKSQKRVIYKTDKIYGDLKQYGLKLPQPVISKIFAKKQLNNHQNTSITTSCSRLSTANQSLYKINHQFMMNTISGMKNQIKEFDQSDWDQ